MADNVEKSDTERHLLSIILPAFNEAAILHDNLDTVVDYLRSLESRHRWEIVIVNDGSSDDTGRIADEYAAGHENIRVLHHKRNFCLLYTSPSPRDED